MPFPIDGFPIEKIEPGVRQFSHLPPGGGRRTEHVIDVLCVVGALGVA